MAIDRPGAMSVAESPSRATAQLRILVLARPVLQEGSASDFLQLEQTSWRRDESAADAEQLIELAGRVCYMSFGERQSARSTREYIRNLVTRGHESVLEHASWTLLVTGVSRSLTHQLVRHRIGFSYSQLSQQYHDERDTPTVVPDVVAADEELRALWERVGREASEAYAELVSELERREEIASDHDARERLRLIRSAARGILPGNTETKLVLTANARSLRHLLSVRSGLTGDDEMRRLTVALLDLLQIEAPSVFEDFQIQQAPDGGPIVLHRPA